MFPVVLWLCGWCRAVFKDEVCVPGHSQDTAAPQQPRAENLWERLKVTQRIKTTFPDHIIMALWIRLTWGFDIYSQTYTLHFFFFIIVDVYFSHSSHPTPETARIYDKHKVRLMYLFLCKIRRFWHLWVSLAHNSVCCWATENVNPSVFKFNIVTEFFHVGGGKNFPVSFLGAAELRGFPVCTEDGTGNTGMKWNLVLAFTNSLVSGKRLSGHLGTEVLPLLCQWGPVMPLAEG